MRQLQNTVDSIGVEMVLKIVFDDILSAKVSSFKEEPGKPLSAHFTRSVPADLPLNVLADKGQSCWPLDCWL